MADVNPVQFQKFLSGVNYPASKDEIMDAARDHGAGKNVLHTIEQLPEQQYQTPADVSQAVGEIE